MTDGTGALPDSAAIEDRVLTFLHREVLGPGVALDRATSLLSGELLDSMSVLRLAVFIGEAFGVHVQPADFVVENFRSVGTIASYVRRRLASPA